MSGFPGSSNGKESACIPWRRAWQTTPVFLPGEFHGQRSLVGSTPQCHNESDTCHKCVTSE